MSTRMLLEGSDIRALLQQVRDDHGPDARIVHAERVRAGGIGGFFAKQRFEVTVELDGDASGPEVDSDALVAAFGEVEEVAPYAAATSSGPDSFTPMPRTRPAGHQRIEPLEPVAEVAPARAVASVSRAGESTATAWTPLDLAAARPAAPAAGGASVPPQGTAVDLVLDALDPAGPRALRPVGPVSTAATSEMRPLPSLVPPALTDPFTPIASQVATSLGGPPSGPFRTTAPHEEPTPLFDLGAWVESRQAALAEASTLRAPAEAAPAPAATAPAHVDPTVIARAAGMAALAGLVAPPAAPVAPTPIADELLATVTPLHVVEPADEVAPPAPAVPSVPRRPGDLLVLVGDAVPAYATARSLASGMRVPADDVVVVAHVPVVPGLPEDRRVADVLDARLHAAQLAAARTAGIVVVDAPASLVADPLGQAWVADVLAALGATAVWAVVDATRRTEDLRSWLAVLPAVEAIAAHSVAATSRPEEVHALELPVAVVDGRPATAADRPRAADPAVQDAAATLRRSS